MQLQALLIVSPAFMALVSSTPLPRKCSQSKSKASLTQQLDGDGDHGLDRRSNETTPVVETQHQSYARETSPRKTFTTW